MVDRAAFVKHKAATVVVRSIGFFKVFQDAAVQLVDVFQAFFAHQNGGLFTADTAGAKAHHGLVFQFIQVAAQCIRKFSELGDAPVHGVIETAFIHFKVIARVQRHHRAAIVVMALIQPALHGGG